MEIKNYIQSNVYGLDGVIQKRSFDDNGNSRDANLTYGDIKTSLTQRNIYKDSNIHKDRVKKIHREAMNIRDNISSICGQIWTRMDQDDARMSRYNFPDKPDYPVGDHQYGRDITDAINTSTDNDDNDVIALREFLTKNTIAPNYNTWIKYGTEKPPYGFKLDKSAITDKINNMVSDHDTQNAEVDIGSGDNEHDYERSVRINGIDTDFTLEKGLAKDKLNIYSYVEVVSNKNPTNVDKKYYYIPAQPWKFTDIVAESGDEGKYHRRYYERYHIVNSKVNSLRDDNSLRYSYSNNDFDLGNLGDEFIFDINTNDTTSTDINATMSLNSSNLTYGDYFREYSKKKWKVFGPTSGTAPTNGRRLDIASADVSSHVTSTTAGSTFDKDLSSNTALNNIYLTKDDYFIYNDGSTDHYIVSAEPGRTVWMITKSAIKENDDKATLQTDVRDVRNKAMNVRDSLSTEPSQLWLKMNRNDSRNSQYLYPELTPIYWNTTNTKPEMGRDLGNVLTSGDLNSLKTYVTNATYSIPVYQASNITQLEPIYFDDYLSDVSNNYYTINYDESRKEMGMNVSSNVYDFLTSSNITTTDNYILNSKVDTKTQNVLMDSLLEKQYGDLYVMNTASSEPEDTRIKPGDYYINSSDSNYIFGQVWVKTNLNKKLDFGRELYDSELTKILKEKVTTDTPGNYSNTYTLTSNDFTTTFTTNDLANLGIKSLDYIYVDTDTTSNIDYYFKAMPNNSNVFDGRRWNEIDIGDTPDESFGRQLYHQNLSEILTRDENQIVLTSDEYTNLKIDKLNLEPSNYIISSNYEMSYRPKPIDIWLSVRSTENQYIYNKHRQESVSDNKYIAQDVRQNSDVPGQIWKKITSNEAIELKFDYGAITPLYWETTSNGSIEPKKGRNLNEYLYGDTLMYNDTPIYGSNVLSELKRYINEGITSNYNLDTFNSTNYSNLSLYSHNGEFYHDDYILVNIGQNGSNLNKPHKYYTINYDNSRNLNTTRGDATTKRLNIHTSKTSNQLIEFLTENNFENYLENYNYPYKKYYVDILNSTRDSKTNIITKYGDEYILLDHRDVPNMEDNSSGVATFVPNNIKYGDYYKHGNDAWVAIRSHIKQKEYDDNTNYNEVRTLAKRKRSESTQPGEIWTKMKKTDPRFSKYNYENLIESNRYNDISSNISYVKFLEKNIPIMNMNSHKQESFILDSKVDFRTNRIIEYGNEYVTFETSYDGPENLLYGQYYKNYKKETINYGDTWYSIGTKKPDKGRLIVSQNISDLIEDGITNNRWLGDSDSVNEIEINVYATETIKSGNNSVNITVLQFLEDFNLTDDDYIECTISISGETQSQYFRPKPHDVWVVTRSLDEKAKYDEMIRIKYRDVYQEAKRIRQSSKTIGQIWIQVDSPNDPSLDKYPHRRQLSTSTITGQLQTLLQTYSTNPYTDDTHAIDQFQNKIYKSDGSLHYVQNRFYVVDSEIDMATYQIKYSDSDTNPAIGRSGLGKELVILDTKNIPEIDATDYDSVIIDGKDMGEILRYGDYYSHNGKYYVVSRSYDEEHTKYLEDQRLKDEERDYQTKLDENTLLNTYQFSDTEDRYGRLWQKVTTLSNYIISDDQKILKHTFTENIIENDGYTLKLTNTELDNLLNDFTMTKVLSTKYIKHPTKNQYYVTTNYGTTWVKHESLPEVGTEIFIKKDDPDGSTDLYFTNDTDKVTLTTSNNFGYIGNTNNTVELSSDEEVLKLLLFNGLIDKHYIKNNGDYYETDNDYNATSNEITWDKVDSIPLDKKYLSESSILDSLLTGSNFTIDAAQYEDLLSSNDYNSWNEHNSRKRHFVTQYININSSNYYISNDEGYNWKKIDHLNRVHNHTHYSYEIKHDYTETILDNGRTLLTTDELDDLLNNAKYSASHGNGSNLTDDLNNQYVSHRLLTNQHYLTDDTNYYIPQPLVNEDYKNYINMPGKGKLGQYWKLRFISTDPTTPITNNYIRNILEGNDNDTNRYQYNKERLTLTADERSVLMGSSISTITINHYISHSTKPNYYYMSNDNGYNWFKVHDVSDSSVRLVQLEQSRDYNDGTSKDLGQIIYELYTNTTTNEFSIEDEEFYNYEVEKYVRENGYIEYTTNGVTYTFVPGEYINEKYNYFPADNEYPAKNTLGRIWNTLTLSTPPSGGTSLSLASPELKELLYSRNILNIDLSSNTFRIDLSTDYDKIYYQATDNKFYYPSNTSVDSWTVKTTRPDDKLEIRLDLSNSGNTGFNTALTTTTPSSNTVTLTSSEYNSIDIDLESNKNVYYKVTDSSDIYYYIPTDSTKLRWYSQKEPPEGSLKIITGGDLTTQFATRSTTNTNIKGTTNYTVTLSYEEYALYVESLDITKENYIQIGDKYYVPGRLINEYNDHFNLS